MNKFFGEIGYISQKEMSPGVYEDEVIERQSRGDILQNMRRWEASESVNDNVVLSNRLSIIADAFMYSNLPSIRYVILNGIKWKVTSLEVIRPRIILTLGEVYNG